MDEHASAFAQRADVRKWVDAWLTEEPVAERPAPKRGTSDQALASQNALLEMAGFGK